MEKVKLTCLILIITSLALAQTWRQGPQTGYSYLRFDGEYFPGTNMVYFLGGRTGTPTDSSIWRYNPVTQAYTDMLVDLPKAISNYDICLLRDNYSLTDTYGLYIVGGRDQAGAMTKVVQVYYPKSNTVRVIGTDTFPGLIGTSSYVPGACVVYNNKLYAYGGLVTTVSPYVTNQTWVFDPLAAAGSRWSRILTADLPLTRSYILGAVVDSFLYAIGGDTFNGTSLFARSQCYRLNAKNVAAGWSTITSLPAPTGEARAFGFDASATYGFPNHIVTAGRGTWPSESAHCYIYNVATNTWSNFVGLDSARRNHAGAFIPQIAGASGTPGMWVWGGRYVNDVTPRRSSEYYAPPLNDVGVDSIVPLTKPLIVGDTYPITVLIRNYGFSVKTSIPVRYNPGDGSGARNETWTGTLLPPPLIPNSVFYTFTQSYIPTDTGVFTLKAYTGLSGDTFYSNDTSSLTMVVCPIYHQTPFAKNFEEGWGPYADNPPFCGWRIHWDGTAAINDWYKGSGTWPMHGSAYATLGNSPPEYPNYDSLISPRLNLTGQANVVLSCSTYWNPYDTTFLAEIKGSIDNGATWPYTIRTYPQTGASFNSYETFNLTWAADQPNVRIAWIGTGNNYGFDYWSIDDITITSQPPVADVGTQAILNPVSNVGINPGDSLQPQARIRNYGNLPRAFPATFRISGTVTYSNTKSVATLAPGDSVDITFDYTPPLTAGYYAMSCSTELSDDANNSNDRVTGNFLVMAGPTLLEPGNGSLINDNTPYFDWTDIPWAVAYEWQLDTLPDFSTAIGAFPTISDWTPPAALADDHYYWRARGSAGGLYGVWSAVWEFDLDATAPNAPTLVQPPNLAIDVSLTPTFIWTQVTFLGKDRFENKPIAQTDNSAITAKPTEGLELDLPVTTYQIQLSTQADFSTLVFDTTVTETSLLCPQTLTGSTVHYWHVRAMDDAGNIGAYAAAFSFTTKSTSTPDVWVKMADLAFGEKPVSKGGCLAYWPDDDTGWIYALKGNNKPAFGRYPVIEGGGTWSALEDMPYALDKQKKPKAGAAMVQLDDYLYVPKGGNRLEFWRYGLPDADSVGWKQLPDVPAGGKRVKGGTVLAAVELNDTDYIFMAKGSKTNEAYLFNIEANTWGLALPGVPLFDKSTSGCGFNESLVYAITYDKGTKLNTVFMGNLKTNTWAKTAEVPLIGTTGKKKKIKEGSALTFDGTQFYMFKGGNVKEFFDYTPGESVKPRADIPLTTKKGVKGGAALAFAEDDGNVYALVGNKVNEFWRYTPVKPTVASITNSPSLEGTTGNKLANGAFKLMIVPNPAINKTTISYSLLMAGPVSFKLYNVAGSLVKTYTNAIPTKNGAITIDAKTIPSGVYILRFNSGDIRVTRKLVLEK